MRVMTITRLFAALAVLGVAGYDTVSCVEARVNTESQAQDAAYAAVRKGVFDYDRRHGYRGPESFVNLGDDPAEQEQALDKAA